MQEIYCNARRFEEGPCVAYTILSSVGDISQQLRCVTLRLVSVQAREVSAKQYDASNEMCYRYAEACVPRDCEATAMLGRSFMLC